MGKSPKLTKMIWPRSAARRVLAGHQFVSEFSGLEKTTMQGEQSETVKYRVFAGTWNVGGVAPPDDLDLEDWLDTKTDSFDIYVLGFQEMVPLNARAVLGPKQRRAAMKWQLLIGDALNKWRQGDGAAAMHDQVQGGVFRCLMSKQMVGIFVSVWMRSSLRRHVRHPAVSSIGAGVLGRLGNKVRYIETESHARYTNSNGVRRARCPSGSCSTARASASSAATWPQAARTATRYAGMPTWPTSSPGPASSAPAARRQHRMRCPRRFLAMTAWCCLETSTTGSPWTATTRWHGSWCGPGNGACCWRTTSCCWSSPVAVSLTGGTRATSPSPRPTSITATRTSSTGALTAASPPAGRRSSTATARRHGATGSCGAARG